jgi:hypothetical protein
LESYLDVRRVDQDFKQTGDAADVAWTIINNSQLQIEGGLGFTQGLSPVTFSISIDIKRGEGKYIFDVLNDIATQSPGFDWQINTIDRQFDIWTPRKNDVANVRLSYGNDEGAGNLKSYAMQIMGKYLKNDIMIRGEAAFSVAIDTTSRTTYGLRQHTENFMDAITVAQLNGRAELIRFLRKEPKFVPSVVCDGRDVNPYVPPAQIDYGDSVRVTIDDGPMQFDDFMRVIGWQLTLGKHDNETYVFYLNDMREVEEEI